MTIFRLFLVSSSSSSIFISSACEIMFVLLFRNIFPYTLTRWERNKKVGTFFLCSRLNCSVERCGSCTRIQTSTRTYTYVHLLNRCTPLLYNCVYNAMASNGSRCIFAGSFVLGCLTLTYSLHFHWIHPNFLCLILLFFFYNKSKTATQSHITLYLYL